MAGNLGEETLRIAGSVVVTNDDGIEADGLQHLVAALEPHVEGAFYVVAPSKCYSGCSQQVSMSHGIAVERMGERHFAVDGSPADCARLALTHLVPDCRLLISGINHGGNMGHDILLSGTVGAARESAVMGVSAVALSQYFQGQRDVDWSASAALALVALSTIMEEPAGDEAALWNVNLPHRPKGTEGIPEIIFSHPCTAALPVAYAASDQVYTYDGARYHERLQAPGTDVSVCFGGGISISRLAVGPMSYRAG